MGETTAISWTDATFNGWIGCTKVSDLCKYCYAARDNGKYKWNGGLWGPGAPRQLTSISNWKKPFQWNIEAFWAGEQKRVFGYSLADVWDQETPMWPADRVLEIPWEVIDKPGGGYRTTWMPVWPARNKCEQRGEPVDTLARQVFFEHMVSRTTSLTWQLLTKRFEEAAAGYNELWGDRPWTNVWPIFSVGPNDLERAMTAMASFKAVVKGISAEPLLGPLDLRPYLHMLQWVIVGGESGSFDEARRMHPQWVRDIREQCADAGVAFFHKQWGEWMPKSQLVMLPKDVQDRVWAKKPRWGSMTVQGEYFETATPWNGHDDDGSGEAVMVLVGKKTAGDLLDGVQYQEFPA